MAGVPPGQTGSSAYASMYAATAASQASTASGSTPRVSSLRASQASTSTPSARASGRIPTKSVQGGPRAQPVPVHEQRAAVVEQYVVGAQVAVVGRVARQVLGGALH